MFEALSRMPYVPLGSRRLYLDFILVRRFRYSGKVCCLCASLHIQSQCSVGTPGAEGIGGRTAVALAICASLLSQQFPRVAFRWGRGGGFG